MEADLCRQRARSYAAIGMAKIDVEIFELRGYIDENGKKRFALWFEGLDAVAAAKVTIALTRPYPN